MKKLGFLGVRVFSGAPDLCPMYGHKPLKCQRMDSTFQGRSVRQKPMNIRAMNYWRRRQPASRFSIEVAATTAGAKFFYNPIRKGSSASDEGVYDAMLGTPLHFEVVSGAEARNDALMPDADLTTNYIKVTLARPVPEHGQGRVLLG